MILFSGNSNIDLSKKIAKEIGIKLGDAIVDKFPEGEISVKINDNVRGKDVFVIQSTCPPVNDNLMELLIMIDALRRASAKRITAVIPFFGYARQDRKDQPRVPITAKLVANLLTQAGADRILTMDLHAGQIQGFFDIPVDHLLAAPVFIDYFKNKKIKNLVVATADIGGIKLAWYFAEKLNTPLVVVDKKRRGPEAVEAMHLIGDVKGKNILIPDDMLATGGTLAQAAKFVKSQGALKIYACMTHGLFSGNAIQKIQDAPIEEIVVTDTIPQHDRSQIKKIKVLSVGWLFGEAIKRIHEERTISQLFK
ncbi:MAG TPA: ribose-phosphate pyrophosphokinase [Candidatus Goldiibacteriota bacterium]|nr:ribose-phosphate pyrophosphokinase [Candidatus Goldiibacteriota bacterium]